LELKMSEIKNVEYTPYGESWVEKSSDDYTNMLPYRFTAKELDEETGLYYYGARYLNPRTSRWISSDPAGFELINPAQRGFSISGLNWYAYTSNNPIMFTDPTGMEEEESSKNIIQNFLDNRQAQQQEYVDKLSENLDAWEGRDSERGLGGKIIASITDPKPPALRIDGEVVPVEGGTLPFISGPAGGSGAIRTGGKIARWASNFGMKAGRYGKQLYSPFSGKFTTISKLFKETSLTRGGQFTAGVAFGIGGDELAPGVQSPSFKAGIIVGKIIGTMSQ